MLLFWYSIYVALSLCSSFDLSLFWTAPLYWGYRDLVCFCVGLEKLLWPGSMMLRHYWLQHALNSSLRTCKLLGCSGSSFLWQLLGYKMSWLRVNFCCWITMQPCSIIKYCGTPTIEKWLMIIDLIHRILHQTFGICYSFVVFYFIQKRKVHTTCSANWCKIICS